MYDMRLMQRNKEKKWRRKFSSAIYAKGIIEEVVTPLPILVDVPTAGSLDDSE